MKLIITFVFLLATINVFGIDNLDECKCSDSIFYSDFSDGDGEEFDTIGSGVDDGYGNLPQNQGKFIGDNNNEYVNDISKVSEECLEDCDLVKDFYLC